MLKRKGETVFFVLVLNAAKQLKYIWHADHLLLLYMYFFGIAELIVIHP